mgnify:FL=1
MEIVYIEDEKLLQSINKALGEKPYWPVTIERIKRLKELSISGEGIEDLTGLIYTA